MMIVVLTIVLGAGRDLPSSVTIVAKSNPHLGWLSLACEASRLHYSCLCSNCRAWISENCRTNDECIKWEGHEWHSLLMIRGIARTQQMPGHDMGTVRLWEALGLAVSYIIDCVRKHTHCQSTLLWGRPLSPLMMQIVLMALGLVHHKCHSLLQSSRLSTPYITLRGMGCVCTN